MARPRAGRSGVGSAITATTDAIAEEGAAEEGRGELLVPYAEAARRFYLPQWVAFDQNDQLLVNSTEEAEAHVASMQRFMEVLFLAVALTPYISADYEYAKKRYGMLGQLVNQGRALAIYQVCEIIARIKQRAAAGLTGFSVTGMAAAPASPSTLYAALYSLGVFTSTNGGASFSPNVQLTTAMSDESGANADQNGYGVPAPISSIRYQVRCTR